MKKPPTPAPTAARRAGGRQGGQSPEAEALLVRPARRSDLDQVIDIDASVTGLEKRKYWSSVFRRYGGGQQPEQQFLVAVADGRVIGFIVGEVRDWEFGSPPCGWVFGISVDPNARLGGVGTRLLESICSAFKRIGVRKLRTMLAIDNTLILSFFRSQGMMAGPLISLEMDLEP